MAEKEYIEREKIWPALNAACVPYNRATAKAIEDIPAADVRPVVTCADCKYNNACLTQEFVEAESRVPFDRNTFFCADGKKADDA